jgi:hypothetical protein
MEDSTKIWRYMDLSKFIGLLSRGIHFCRPSALGDESEGSWGVKNITRFEEKYFGQPKEGAIEWNVRVTEKRRRLDEVGVSCWHSSECESAALWELYMPQGLGVAVQSTVGSIISAIASIDRIVEVIEVCYIDFTKEELPLEPMILLARKRREFRHENEVRFLLGFTADEQKAIDMEKQVHAERDTRWMSLSLLNGGRILPGPYISVTDRTALDRATPVGIHLRVPSVSIIENVYLAPKVSQPVRNAVCDVVEKYGLDSGIISESSKDMIAPDRLRFFP